MSNEIKKQKAIADRVLEKIELMDPSAIVAGGAPRDWHFDREAKDLDVFLYWRKDLNNGFLKNTLEKLGFNVSRKAWDESCEKPGYKRNEIIHSVWDSEVDGFPVQFIICRSPTFGVVETFPLSICQAWYKNGKVRTTRSFKTGENNKYILKTNDLYADGDDYVARILKKFPDMHYYSTRETLINSLIG